MYDLSPPADIIVNFEQQDWDAAVAARATPTTYYFFSDCAVAQAIRRAVPGATVEAYFWSAVVNGHRYDMQPELVAVHRAFDGGREFPGPVISVLRIRTAHGSRADRHHRALR